MTGKIDEKLWFAYKKAIPLLIQNFTAAEGAMFTLPEVNTYLQSRYVVGYDDHDVKILNNVIDGFRKLNELLVTGEFSLFSKECFFSLNAEVAKEEALLWGTWRRGQVWINGTTYVPPQAKKLDDLWGILMHLLKVRDLTEVERAIEFHLQATRVQFFYDGNKRTSRLMAYGHLLQNGFMPFSLEPEYLLQYNNYFIEYMNTADSRRLVALLKDRQSFWQSRYMEL